MTWYQKLFLVLRMLIHIPGILLGWLFVLLFSWAAHKHRIEYPLILTAQLRDWAAKHWRFSTTVSRGMLMQKYARRANTASALTRTEEHERIHVDQSEDFTTLGLILALLVSSATGNWWWMLLWLFSPLFQLANFVGALFRHARPCPDGRSWYDHWVLRVLYLGSEHEKSAYSQTDGHPNSWLARYRRNS